MEKISFKKFPGKAGTYSSVVQHFPGMHDLLSLISTAKTQDIAKTNTLSK
jgi:hypothetical protein